jgi:hypothetical protein
VVSEGVFTDDIMQTGLVGVSGGMACDEPTPPAGDGGWRRWTWHVFQVSLPKSLFDKQKHTQGEPYCGIAVFLFLLLLHLCQIAKSSGACSHVSRQRRV